MGAGSHASHRSRCTVRLHVQTLQSAPLAFFSHFFPLHFCFVPALILLVYIVVPHELDNTAFFCRFCPWALSAAS